MSDDPNNPTFPIPKPAPRPRRRMVYDNRVSCSGGCGRRVLPNLGECRKCHRKRIHAGLKRIKSIEKDQAWKQAHPKAPEAE